MSLLGKVGGGSSKRGGGRECLNDEISLAGEAGFFLQTSNGVMQLDPERIY